MVRVLSNVSVTWNTLTDSIGHHSKKFTEPLGLPVGHQIENGPGRYRKEPEPNHQKIARRENSAGRLVRLPVNKRYCLRDQHITTKYYGRIQH